MSAAPPQDDARAPPTATSDEWSLFIESISVKTLESKSVVLLRHHLKALRLPTIGADGKA